MKRSLLPTISACVLSLAVAGCQARPAVTDPCDILIVIPAAPAHVNALMVRDARPTAEGLARHKQRTTRYGC